jgi:hypothetical protein
VKEQTMTQTAEPVEDLSDEDGAVVRRLYDNWLSLGTAAYSGAGFEGQDASVFADAEAAADRAYDALTMVVDCAGIAGSRWDPRRRATSEEGTKDDDDTTL